MTAPGPRCCTLPLPQPEPGQPVPCPECGGLWVTDRLGNTARITPEHLEAIRNPQWTAGHATVHQETVVFYRASVPFGYPVTDMTDPSLGSSILESVTCGHRHRDYAAAQACGDQLRNSEIRRRNRH